MRGADTVNDEFEVGYNQRFESGWYKAEIAGRFIMVGFVTIALLGFLGRGPFSHESVSSRLKTFTVDYEPVARHGTASMITVHLKQPRAEPFSIRLLLDQHLLEPMGLQREMPTPDHSSVSDKGVWMTFTEEAGQKDALVRFNVSPEALGPVPLQISDGTDSASWTMFVVP